MADTATAAAPAAGDRGAAAAWQVEFDERQRDEAMRRWLLLRPCVEDGMPLRAAASGAGVPLRTAQRWLNQYRAGGLAALARRRRSDCGSRRVSPEVVKLIEGLALRGAPLSVRLVHREILAAARQAAWAAPSYGTVYAIFRETRSRAGKCERHSMTGDVLESSATLARPGSALPDARGVGRGGDIAHPQAKDGG